MKHPLFISILIAFFSGSLWIETKDIKASAAYPGPDSARVLTRIAIGSCNQQNTEQPLWKFIIRNDPDLFIWLGDNVYADTQDPEFLKLQYSKQKNNPEYRNLLRSTPVIGTWDDHDYGVDDGGKEYPMKKISQQLLLDFLDVPQDAPQRRREGVYSSCIFGKENQKVKIILLDARYFRDPLPKDKDKNIRPNKRGDMLGGAQWQWLEQELNTSGIQLFIIGNGTQIIPDKYPFEKWSNFPKSRKRLFELLKKNQDKKILLLSGDLHMGEISKIKPWGFRKPVYELTSSGMTHYYDKKPKNRYRVGEPANQLNFGIIELAWNENPVKVKLQLRGLDNKILTEEWME